ncbi:MAG: hypothetical protein HKN21_07890 [Candidatus Eisenbacteria bacterium]|uniref:DUF302 domain-containing protein n=1 Tax=Eiseniibacteriota bacterium TaxID=2212470 RepID=A0A7Y2H262_UNCEI|nr:hypothetical protein [Candidatus Eisenbacteria bacterium]
MNAQRVSHTYSLIAALCFFTLFSTAAAVAAPPSQGVFEYVVEQVEGDFDAIAEAIETAATAGGWQVLAVTDAGVDKDCSFRARVLLLLDLDYAAELVRANPETGAFAAPDRINLFEDEAGTHVSVVNPRSLNRTILMEDSANEEMTEAHLGKLRAMILDVVPGTKSERQYGQIRDKGFIGKTMGVVAGGKFKDLIREVASVDGGDLAEVADKLEKGLAVTGKKWGLTLTHSVALPELNTYILGTTGTPMDSKSFSIVGAGGDEARKEYECPGNAYAAAYPIELVVTLEDGDVKVRIVEPMFRMKMYFEDAGKIAFMKNMKMPDSLAKELKKQVKKGLKG